MGSYLWAVLSMSEDQLMQVMLVPSVAKYAGASMSAISSLAIMLSQWPASVRRKRKKNLLHRELSAATLIRFFVFIERVQIEGSQQFTVQGSQNKSRCLVLNARVNIKGGRAKWLGFCCWWTCADSE